MNQNAKEQWWELHVKKARGEGLSEEEEQRYGAELAKQDQDSGPGDIGLLQKLRMEVVSQADENAMLRARIAGLEAEIQTLENALSKQTKELLGVRG